MSLYESLTVYPTISSLFLWPFLFMPVLVFLFTKLLPPDYQRHGMTPTDIWTFDGWKMLRGFSLAVFKINILQNKSKDFRIVRVLSAGSLLSKGCFHAHVSASSSRNSFLTPSFRVYRRTCQWYNIYWSVKHISKTPATSIFKMLRRRISPRKMEKGQFESFINLNIPEESRDVYASSSRTPPPPPS